MPVFDQEDDMQVAENRRHKDLLPMLTRSLCEMLAAPGQLPSTREQVEVYETFQRAGFGQGEGAVEAAAKNALHWTREMIVGPATPLTNVIKRSRDSDHGEEGKFRQGGCYGDDELRFACFGSHLTRLAKVDKVS